MMINLFGSLIRALIGKIARVSNPKNENNPEVEGLLKYLIKHKHWSPFEVASMCVEIHTTRAISPQILRHRNFSFQEFSQRYAIPTDSFATVQPKLRRQDTKNRQNSDLPQETVEYYDERIDNHFRQSVYESLLHSGVAKGVLALCFLSTQSHACICQAHCVAGCTM